MGLNKNTGTPCGFCFVEYYNRHDAEMAKKCLNLKMLDGNEIRIDFDLGFREGKQYGRGKFGGQIRTEITNRRKLRENNYNRGEGGYNRGEGGYQRRGGYSRDYNRRGGFNRDHRDRRDFRPRRDFGDRRDHGDRRDFGNRNNYNRDTRRRERDYSGDDAEFEKYRERRNYRPYDQYKSSRRSRSGSKSSSA